MEIVSDSLAIPPQRMLYDHLKLLYYKRKLKLHQIGKHINTEYEHGFGLLGRLIRLITKVLNLTYEKLITVTKNKTNLCKDQLRNNRLGNDNLKFSKPGNFGFFL